MMCWRTFNRYLLGFALAMQWSYAMSAPGAVNFVQNASGDHEYGELAQLPSSFGAGEFTLELWIKPDDSFPVGSTAQNTSGQLVNWSSADPQPYSRSDWWWKGNFLLDGHNNGAFQNGTFSLQIYGGGRLRWLFGDGAAAAGNAGSLWAVQAWPASNAPSLLDGSWHQITLVRRWETSGGGARLEMWIDGTQIASTTTTARTDMAASYWNSWSGFPQSSWHWGVEKQAAVGALSQYEDYKGLIDEVRFWSRAKSTSEIASDYNNTVLGSEVGLVGHIEFSEAQGGQACDSLQSSRCINLRNTPAGGMWSVESAPLTNVGGDITIPNPPTTVRAD